MPRADFPQPFLGRNHLSRRCAMAMPACPRESHETLGRRWALRQPDLPGPGRGGGTLPEHAHHEGPQAPPPQRSRGRLLGKTSRAGSSVLRPLGGACSGFLCCYKPHVWPIRSDLAVCRLGLSIPETHLPPGKQSDSICRGGLDTHSSYHSKPAEMTLAEKQDISKRHSRTFHLEQAAHCVFHMLLCKT